MTGLTNIHFSLDADVGIRIHPDPEVETKAIEPISEANSKNKPNNLMRLSEETLINIFSFSFHDFIHLALVSRQFNEFVKKPDVWMRIYRTSSYPQILNNYLSSTESSPKAIIRVIETQNDYLNNRAIQMGEEHLLEYSNYCHFKIRKWLGVALFIIGAVSLVIESQRQNVNWFVGSALCNIGVNFTHVFLSFANLQENLNRHKKNLKCWQISISTGSILFGIFIKNRLPITAAMHMISGSTLLVGVVPKEFYLSTYKRGEKRKIKPRVHIHQREVTPPPRVNLCSIICSIIRGLFSRSSSRAG